MMKIPLLSFTCTAALLLGTSLFAQQGGGFVSPRQNSGKGGFVAPPRVYQVRDVKELPDDTKVVFAGFITEQVDKDKYVFNGVVINGQEPPFSAWTRDSNDVIVVQIDDDLWQGRTITPKDMVRIEGEVDRDEGEVTIEVKRLNQINLPAESRRRARPLRGQRLQQITCPHCGQGFGLQPVAEPAAAPVMR